MREPFPHLLRQYRSRRRWSQEQLGLEADVSPRHLSCLETGKAWPSREMVLRIARVLDLELRERNGLLVSAGFAAAYATSSLEATSMAPVNRAVELLMTQQEPYGSILVDRTWNVLRVNEGGRRLLAAFLPREGVSAPIASNLVRATLHPEGLRPYIVNFHEVAPMVRERVERAHHAHPEDEARRALWEEVRSYPGMGPRTSAMAPSTLPVAVLHLRREADQGGPSEACELRLFSLLTTIGTPLDVTAQDMALESFFPADDATERWFREV